MGEVYIRGALKTFVGISGPWRKKGQTLCMEILPGDFLEAAKVKGISHRPKDPMIPRLCSKIIEAHIQAS